MGPGPALGTAPQQEPPDVDNVRQGLGRERTRMTGPPRRRPTPYGGGMGFKCTLLAHSPQVPREDITTQPEGGADAAAAYLAQRWPGQWQLDHTATLDEGFNPGDESLWVGTWGRTVVLAGDPIFEMVSDQPVDDEWMLMVHSVVDACSYRTPPSHGGRVVDLSADSTIDDKRAALSGGLLPFEEPYARGEHDQEAEDFGDDDFGPPGFHPLDLANSAVHWILGTVGETPPTDDVSVTITPVNPWEMPFHRFVPAAASHQPVSPAQAAAPVPEKKGFFARLLGR